MDEYNTGMDPEVKLYFRKILNTFGAGLLWLLVMATAGFYFQLAQIKKGVQWYNIVFYGLFLGSLTVLVLYFFKIWQKRHTPENESR